MRHFFASRPVAACPIGMRAPSPAAGLVTPPAARWRRRRARRRSSGAVDLAAVAATANQRLGAASRADKQPCRRCVVMAGTATPRGRTPRLPRYWPCMRARHGVGHGVERNCQVELGAVLAPLVKASLYPSWATPSACARRNHAGRITPTTRPVASTPAAGFSSSHVAGIRRF